MSKEKIIIVDDAQDLVKLIQYHMGKDGYKVISAYNGNDAFPGELPFPKVFLVPISFTSWIPSVLFKRIS